MKLRISLAGSVAGIALLLAACSGKGAPTPVPTAPTKAAPIVINAPVPVGPTDGSTANGWPTLVVTDAVTTGTTATLVYRFDISTTADFTNIIITSTIVAGTSQTSFTPTLSPGPADQTTLYWRVTAIDQADNVQSSASATQSFKFSNPPTQAARIATQEGLVLWPGVQPTGVPGNATMGDGWGVTTLVSFDGVQFASPTVDELQVFDLLDRGMQPQAAIDWMHGNGYGTSAAWFPSVAVIGFPHQYMALINGRWDMVLRAGS